MQQCTTVPQGDLPENGLVADSCPAQACFICNKSGSPGMAVVCINDLQRVRPASAYGGKNCTVTTLRRGGEVNCTVLDLPQMGRTLCALHRELLQPYILHTSGPRQICCCWLQQAPMGKSQHRAMSLTALRCSMAR